MTQAHIWFPHCYTEAHRTPERQLDLFQALVAAGCCVDRNDEPQPHYPYTATVCGSIFKADHIRRHAPDGVPIVHYNWDLYPHIIQTRWDQGWGQYLEDLKACAAVLVPGVGTSVRTLKYTGRRSAIVKAPVKLWEVPPAPIECPYKPGHYILDVMRDYPWDRGHVYPEQACRKLGVPLVRTRTNEPWDTFRWLVANAAALVSAVDEASTGGLTLLEGYAHGVPVIASDSGWNETGRYFGDDRASYFDATVGVDDLVRVIDDVMSQPCKTPSEVAEGRAWVQSNFSDKVFAENLLREVLACRKTSTS